MLYPRGSLAVTAMGDSVYAIGGFNSKEALHIVEVMDTRNNKWRSLSSLSTERAYGEAAVIDDEVSTLVYCTCDLARVLNICVMLLCTCLLISTSSYCPVAGFPQQDMLVPHFTRVTRALPSMK